MGGRSRCAAWKSLADATGCHILYISSSEAAQLAQIMSALKGRNVLTVSDLDDFVQKRRHHPLRSRWISTCGWVINPQAAQAAGPKLSRSCCAPRARPHRGRVSRGAAQHNRSGAGS